MSDAIPGEPLIEVENLRHRYDNKTWAVDDLSLTVRAGEVYGLLGHNGAGKTTTIKALLGLLRPTEGRTRVLGLDSGRAGVEIRRRSGYVPENLQAYDWMTVNETLWFVAQFHPTWDAALQDELVRRLELPLSKKMGELSRGTSAKVALACATAFHPEVLILDDPTSGIDALVRREFLEQVIELAAEGGRAVLFSSHVLDEVERLADTVAIVVGGRKVFERGVEATKAGFRRVDLTFADEARARSLEMPEALSSRCEGRVRELVFDAFGPELETRLRACGASELRVSELSLEDVFVEVVKAAKRRGLGSEAA